MCLQNAQKRASSEQIEIRMINPKRQRATGMEEEIPTQAQETTRRAIDWLKPGGKLFAEFEKHGDPTGNEIQSNVGSVRPNGSCDNGEHLDETAAQSATAHPPQPPPSRDG